MRGFFVSLRRMPMDFAAQQGIYFAHMRFSSTVKKMTGSAVLIAIAIILPLCFHGIANAGSIFSPMHIPVLIAGFLFGPVYGAAVGVLSPVLNSFITGMPPLYPVLPGMAVECFLYGLTTGFAFRLIKTKWIWVDLYASLVIAMLVGRAGGGFVNFLVYVGRGDSYSWTAFLTAYFVTGWPAILIQLALIPALVYSLFRAKIMTSDDRELFPNRERKAEAEKQAVYFSAFAEKWAPKGALSPEKAGAVLAPLGGLEGKKVLDVGCGTGVLEPYLSARAKEITAIDVSPSMIEEAKKGDYPNVSFVNDDYLEAKLGERSYDAIVCFNSYPHFLNVDAFVEASSRFLRKGGRLLIAFDHGRESVNAHHAKHGGNAISRLLLEISKEAFPYWKQFRLVEGKDAPDAYFILFERR